MRLYNEDLCLFAVFTRHDFNELACEILVFNTLSSYEDKDEPAKMHRLARAFASLYMRGSRKFCQRGPNLTCFFLVDEGREGPNTTIIGPSSARQRIAI